MDMTLRPATPAERLFAYEQSAQISERCGNPGYLWGELDNSGSIFLHSWETLVRSEKTPEFKAEFDTVLDMLRFDERYGHVLKNRATMIVYCLDHSQGSFRNGYEYAFRADTRDYSYLIRCTPAGEDNHVHIYPYRRDCLDRHMKQAEKGIRFITPHYEEKFRVADGDKVRIRRFDGRDFERVCRYIDDCHVEIGNELYHICQFAEIMERNGNSVIPLRSSLPAVCYGKVPEKRAIVMFERGFDGYRSASFATKGRTSQKLVDELNGEMGVTKAQAAAMLAGATQGWATPAADPKNYDEQGQTIKPRRPDRGDAR